jgi:hypothetical protein
MSNLEYQGVSERTAIAGSQERQGLTAGDIWGQRNQNTLQPKYDSAVAQAVIAATAVQGIDTTLNSWSKSSTVVNDSLLSIGPALDTAVNYYASTNFDQMGRDAQSALGAISDTIDDKLGRPITVKEQGHHIECASLFFLPGQVNPVARSEAELLGLEKMTQEELEAQGIKKIEDHGTKFINKESFGVENLQTFDARMTMKDGVMKFDIDYLTQPNDLPPPNMFKVFNQIRNIAKEEGAVEIEVRGVQWNEKLFDVLKRRYNAQWDTDGINDVFRFKIER